MSKEKDKDSNSMSLMRQRKFVRQTSENHHPILKVLNLSDILDCYEMNYRRQSREKHNMHHHSQ